jgi:hypothetical protein
LAFLWSFIEICIAFLLIFYNIYMYIYYFFLFLIDRGSETSSGVFRLRGTYGKTSHVSKFEITGGPTIIPPMYGSIQKFDSVVNKTATGAAGIMLKTVRSSAPKGIKKSTPVKSLNSFFDALISFSQIIVYPFKKLVLLFDRGMEIRNERETKPDDRKSLIEEYIKEYEQKKK